MSLREFAIRLPAARLVELASEQLRDISLGATFWLTAVTLLCSLLLGGGTRSGFLSDALLQLIAIPPLLLSASRLGDVLRRDAAKRRQVRWELKFCAAIVLVPLIQLVPLPPALWTLLPGHDALAASLDAAGQPLPWMPISVSPNDTWLSLTALLPPLAIFFGTILLSYRERRMLSLVVIAFGVASAFLGLVQIAQGSGSALRFFAITNFSEAVGFFANRNHFAALLYVVLLFTAVWLIDVGFATAVWRDRKALETGAIMTMTAGFLAIVVLLAAEAMSHSRAGLILTIVSLGGAYALTLTDRRRAFSATPSNLLLLAAGTAAILVVQFALYGILNRFAADPLDDARIQFLQNTLAAAKAYLPFGSGMGTFVPVYAMFERPENLFAHRYVNHAHDDIAELLLEAGVMAAALMAAFAVWFVARAMKIWRRLVPGVAEFDRSLARAATLAIALLIAHSFLDYPLRTAALMGIFAFGCGLMVEPLTADARRPERKSQIPHDAPAARAAHRPAAAPAVAALPAASNAASAPAAPPRKPAARWGEDIEWPEAWRKSGKAAKSGSQETKPPNQEPEP